MFSDFVRQRPQGLALDDLRQQRSWAELSDRTNRIANLLRSELGMTPDDHCALLMDNRAEAIELLLGSILAGVWMTPINFHLQPREVAYIVRDSGARVLFHDDRHAETARAAATACSEAGSTAPTLIRIGDELETALRLASDHPSNLSGPPGSNMIYTSGTTGLPKGVKRKRPASLTAAIEGYRAYARRIGCDGSGPHLVTGPLYHAAPLMFAVYDQACGAPILSMPRWDEAQCLELLRERAVHHMHLVPTMCVRLLRLREERRAGFDAPELHTVLHGAAPIAIDTKRAMLDWWGPIFLEYWGGTEGGVNTLIDSHEWLAHPGSVGRALPAFEVFAVDEGGSRLEPGQVGDLYCRHRETARFFEYHHAPEKTASAFLPDDDHAFTLGDMGSVGADGYVFLADRRSHMIISGGVNIYPAGIEAVLQQHPAVADVAVFGVPDDEWGESVKAAVELAPGHRPDAAQAEEILAFARDRLAGYDVPRSIDFEPTLPRDTSGKLYLRRLRDPYWAGRDRKI